MTGLEFRIVKMALLGAVTVGFGAAHADLTRCRTQAQQSAFKCDKAFQTLSGGKLDDDGGGDQSGGETPEVGINQGAATFKASADANQAVWQQVPPYCRREKSACAEACNAVDPEEKQLADDAKLNCFTKIEAMIAKANRAVESFSQMSAMTAASHDEASAEGENSLSKSGDDAQV